MTSQISLQRKPPLIFLKGKLWTIVYPYFLWSLLQGLIMNALSSLTNTKKTLENLATIGWYPIGQFWFLYVLMIYQIIASVAFRQRLGLLIISAGLYVVASFARLPQLPQEICHFMIFFMLGLIDMTGIIAFIRGRQSQVLLPVILCFAAATYVSGLADHTNYYSVLSLPSTLLGIGVILAVSQTADPRVARGLTALGAASMTIYVLHIMFSAGTRIFLAKLHLTDNAWLYLAATSAVGVAGPYAVHQALARYQLLAPLGLAPWRGKLVQRNNAV